MKKLAVSLFVLCNSLWFSILQGEESHVFLLSYPRSGNTWMRFCLEYLTGRPTRSWKENPADMKIYSYPLGFTISELKIDVSKPCIWKVHSRKKIEQITPLCPQRDKIILLIRNYRECLLRNLKSPVDVLSELQNPHSIYFDNLYLYEEWNPTLRLMIHYEDLLENPATELEKVLLFLEEPVSRLEDFLLNLPTLKQLSLEFYRNNIGPTKSHGIDMNSHSKKIPKPLREKMNLEVMHRFPLFWQCYLSRYE